MVARKGSSGPFASTDDILNASEVEGDTATAALDALFEVAKPSTLARLIGSNLSADVNLILLPAGHAPGFYAVGAFVVVRAVAAAGSLNRVFSCNGPGGVAGTTVSSTSGTLLQSLSWGPGGAGTQWFPLACLLSDGSANIVASFTRLAVTGTPLVDFYGFARLMGE